MSKEEQTLALGRAVEEYGEVKKRVAVLKGEAARQSDKLHAWGRFFSESAAGPIVFHGATDPGSEFGKVPMQDKLDELAADIREALDRKRLLAQRLTEAGYEPKA